MINTNVSSGVPDIVHEIFIEGQPPSCAKQHLRYRTQKAWGKQLVSSIEEKKSAGANVYARVKNGDITIASSSILKRDKVDVQELLCAALRTIPGDKVYCEATLDEQTGKRLICFREDAAGGGAELCYRSAPQGTKPLSWQLL